MRSSVKSIHWAERASNGYTRGPQYLEELRKPKKNKENSFLDTEKMAVSKSIPLVLEPSLHVRYFRSSSDFFMLGPLVALVNSAFVNLPHINLVTVLGYVALAALTYKVPAYLLQRYGFSGLLPKWLYLW